MKRFRALLPLVPILLLAFLLRAYALSAIPPGLTHDEANHGREAISILNGNLALFFPLNYGSEPLYSYTVAGSMLLLGKGVLALRLVNVFFGLLAVAATYRWARLAFGRHVGWLAATLMAVSFWPLAASREALRVGMLPFFFTGAVIFFWYLLRNASRPSASAGQGVSPAAAAPATLLTAAFVFCLTATLYNYLAARVLWLVFPLFLLYLTIMQREVARRLWRPVIGGLLLTGLLALPMFVYLQRYPEAQTRLQMFSDPMTLLQIDNLLPTLGRAGSAFLAFFWPGYGDQFLAYNIPGRPVFDAITAIFFLAGVGICLWRWRRPAYALLLLWFSVGILPSLLTGATANTTRNAGAMPALMILPAIGFVTTARVAVGDLRGRARRLTVVAASLWLIVAASSSAFDYFARWAQRPDVRAAYQHTLVEALDYIQRQPAPGAVVISSVYPGVAHNPSIGLVLAGEDGDRRWIDARQAFLFPNGDGGQLLVPAATPLHPAFAAWVEPVQTILLREDDLNPSFTHYQIKVPTPLMPEDSPVAFGREAPALTLLGSRWLDGEVAPGTTAELLSVWRVDDPDGVGPRVPPLDVTEVVLFTHLLDSRGAILAQQDRLDAPSWDWQAGDVIVQIHAIPIPAGVSQGRYGAVVGVYDRQTATRLPVLASGGAQTESPVAPLQIMP